MSTYQNNMTPRFWEDHTFDRLVEQYGAARARLIRSGQDPKTIIDLNKWSSLGSRRRAS